MDIIKVIGIGIIGAVVAAVLKGDKPEFAVMAITATGLIILAYVISALSEVIVQFNLILSESGVDEALFSGVLKIIGIGYLTEYSANMCTDFGSGTVGQKIQLAGKITIFLMAMPIISAMIKLIAGIVQ